jgi:hypothetical protein
MAAVRCPNCNAENDPAGAGGLCDRCGASLLAETETGIANALERPARHADPEAINEGRHDDDFRRRAEIKARKALNLASGILFAVGGWEFVTGFVAVVANLPHIFGCYFRGEELLPNIGIMYALGMVYIGLGVWARYQPLPATILGLCVHGLSCMVEMASCGRFDKAFLIRCIIAVGLIQGIAAASRYRYYRSRISLEPRG